ncbi:MAG: hypothetical protein LBD93_08605, partial [Treponema sp.]|nr:hypothetical protein [Treponema sp.]
WLKQTFAQRYNRQAGRIGHIWGERYGSRIVEGEPAEVEGTGVGAFNRGDTLRVRPYEGGNEGKTDFLLIFPFPVVLSPG